MGINGIATRTREMLPEEAIAAKQFQYAGQLALFGQKRLEMVESDVANPEAVSELVWQVEQLCTARGSECFMGVSRRVMHTVGKRGGSPPIELTWNPAGILGGFGVQPGWDGAVASIGGVHNERTWAVSEGSFMPRPHHVTEGIYVDRKSGLAMIQKTMWPIVGYGASRSSTKPATADELDSTLSALAPYIEQDKLAACSESVSQMPRFLEIGYGLDPSAIRGRRAFFSKVGLGLDGTTGDYTNDIGEYPEAVRMKTIEFRHNAAAERPGQHILFTIGDAGHLPFSTSSVREVFMSNVINADLDNDARANILAESRRVLEASGSLILRVNWHQDIWPHDKMVGLIKDSGFRVVRSVASSEAECQSLEAQFGTPTEIKAPEGYYVIALPG